MKKILITSYDMEVGGVERSLISMLENFDYENYDVDLLLYSHTGELLSLLPNQANLLAENKKYKFCRKSIKELLVQGKFDLFMGRILANIFAKLRGKEKSEIGYYQMQLIWKYCLRFLPEVKETYDVAISYLWPHDFVARKVKAKTKIAWIHTDYSKIWIDEEIDLDIWSQFNYIVSISEDVTRSFLNKYPSLKEKIVMVENITSPTFVKRLAEDEKQKIFFDKEKFNIVSVGRLCYAKGYDNAIKALRKVHDKGLTDIKWHIVGYGADEVMLKELIKEYKLEDSFILHGKKINPYPYMKASDLYVQPSRYEGKAVTVSEAKILGKAVLITNYDTAHSQLEHEVDGYITDLSIDGIADGIRLLYLNQELKSKLELTTQKMDYGNKSELQKLYELM